MTGCLRSTRVFVSRPRPDRGVLSDKALAPTIHILANPPSYPFGQRPLPRRGGWSIEPLTRDYPSWSCSNTELRCERITNHSSSGAECIGNEAGPTESTRACHTQSVGVRGSGRCSSAMQCSPSPVADGPPLERRSLGAGNPARWFHYPRLSGRTRHGRQQRLPIGQRPPASVAAPQETRMPNGTRTTRRDLARPCRITPSFPSPPCC